VNASSYIVELEASSIRVVAQLVHMFLLNHPNHEGAKAALDELVLNTQGVHREPEKHNVYTSALTAPDKAKEFPSVFYIPAS